MNTLKSIKNRKIGFKQFFIKKIIEHSLLTSFLFGLLIRIIPEILSFPYLIGFDTQNLYLVRLVEGEVFHHWSNFFTNTWLFYAIFTPLYNSSQLSSILVMKLSAPIIYGLNVSGIYYFAKKVLFWENKKSLLASILFSIHIASLRISWDLYRNSLGLAMLLFSLSLIPETINGKKTLLFSFLSGLTIFSHEFSGVLLILITLGMIFVKYKVKSDENYNRLVYSIIPALAIFLLGMYFRIFPIQIDLPVENFVRADDLNYAPVSGLFFLRNYLEVSIPPEHYNSFIELTLHILSLSILLYGISLPIVNKGFFRGKILDLWTSILLISSFNSLITPFIALIFWERWLFMLVYPLTFYTVNGLEKVFKEKNLKWQRGSKVILAFQIGMCISFISLPPNLALYSFPTTLSYFPSSMQQNTIPLNDVDSTISCIRWLNQNMNADSCVITHHAFSAYMQLYLDKNFTIIYFAMNLTKASELAQQMDFKETYLIWWSEDIGWYSNIKIPVRFQLVHVECRIGIYNYS
jgi:hypothetical protein